MKAIATIGASGSGKSTWAKAFLAERAAAGESWTELNKDELRMEILALRGSRPDQMRQGLLSWNYDPAGQDEAEAKALLSARLGSAVARGADGVVFSNTNLDGGAQARGQLAAAGADPAILEAKAFALDFDECVRRDAAREFSVGRSVIEMQFGKLAALGMGFPELPQPAKAPSLK